MDRDMRAELDEAFAKALAEYKQMMDRHGAEEAQYESGVVTGMVNCAALFGITLNRKEN